MSIDYTHLLHNQHASFISKLTQVEKGKPTKRHRKRTFKKITDVIVRQGIKYPVLMTETCLEPGIKLHPEALAFIFYTGGCSKNLLMFILIQKHDNYSGRYNFNVSVVAEFQDFCRKHFGEDYTESTIKQAHRALVESNITLNIKTGTYFLNPLLSGGVNRSGRRNLIKEYTEHLIQKDKNPYVDMYPKYNKL